MSIGKGIQWETVNTFSNKKTFFILNRFRMQEKYQAIENNYISNTKIEDQ